MYYTGNRYLTEDEMKVNATYIYNKLLEAGWTAAAICGFLGNVEAESGINPGIWENLDPSDTSKGYGLVQWSPSTKYTDWCFNNSLPSREMDTALQRIQYEIDLDVTNPNSNQWISTSSYPMSFKQFTTSTMSASYLASVFLVNYERPKVPNHLERQANANKWWTYLTGNTPDEPDVPDEPGGTTTKKKKGYNFVLFGASKKRLRGML